MTQLSEPFLFKDTIFALATPPGMSAMAIFRVSGPKTKEIAELLTKIQDPVARKAYLARFQYNEMPIDQGIFLFFPAPRSFTGEDCLEFHVHGSPAIIKLMTSVLSQIPSVRQAEPGEFAKRAFYNDKLDLLEVEALSALIRSETEHQRRIALRQLSGEQGKLYDKWHQALLTLLAFFEADIDFVDGEIPDYITQKISEDIRKLKNEIENHLKEYRIGEKIRDGLKIAIIGPPNVGKSTLLNLLAKREMAIVSPIPGTTRDSLELHLDIEGYPVILVDTAGLRETKDVLEGEGIKRTKLWEEMADIKIYVQAYPWEDKCQEFDSKNIYLLNKIDLCHENLFLNNHYIPVSFKTGFGYSLFIEQLHQKIVQCFDNSASFILTNERQFQLLKKLCEHLELFFHTHLPELKAEELRLAMITLSKITGKVDIEDILGKIFSNFCIGK